MPPFIFDLYDKDSLGEDFICRSIIPIKESAYATNDEVPKPFWHPCRLKPNAPK